MEGTMYRMRLAAMAFAGLVILGVLFVLGNEGSNGLFGADRAGERAAAPATRAAAPPLPESVDTVIDHGEFATDEDLIDDAAGLSAEGFDAAGIDTDELDVSGTEPEPMIAGDHDTDSVDEMVVIDE